MTKSRKAYLQVWKDCIVNSKRKVRKGYTGKPYPPDFSYNVTGYNFQVTDDVVYKLRFSPKDEPLTVDFVNYLGYWTSKFFAGERIYVYSEKRAEFVVVHKIPDILDEALYEGNLIFSTKGFQPYGVDITKDFELIEVYDEGGYLITEGDTMDYGALKDAVETVDTETVLTDYQRKPKYVVVSYNKKTGNELGKTLVCSKKDLKELLEDPSSLNTYRVVYKLAKTYTAQLPVVEVD